MYCPVVPVPHTCWWHVRSSTCPCKAIPYISPALDSTSESEHRGPTMAITPHHSLLGITTNCCTQHSHTSQDQAGTAKCISIYTKHLLTHVYSLYTVMAFNAVTKQLQRWYSLNKYLNASKHYGDNARAAHQHAPTIAQLSTYPHYYQNQQTISNTTPCHYIYNVL